MNNVKLGSQNKRLLELEKFAIGIQKEIFSHLIVALKTEEENSEN
jgi:hypothetical protein